MSFYSEWKHAIDTGSCESAYLHGFLTPSFDSVDSLHNGDDKELQDAYDVLRSIPLDRFFEELKSFSTRPALTAADVPCFSTMENGVSRLNELLMFSPDGLTYSEIGYQLMNSETDVAQKKYGENQAKLAEIMSLVTLTKKKSVIVKPTAWGTFMTRYDYSDKKDVFKKLALRNPCIKELLICAFDGPVNYVDVVAFLKKSTQKRRGTNVRFLTNFILKDSERELVLSNIDWKV